MYGGAAARSPLSRAILLIFGAMRVAPPLQGNTNARLTGESLEMLGRALANEKASSD
jgi:hypothetical protein